MSDIKLKKLNDTYLKVICDDGIAKELSEKFSFYAPNYRFMPQFRFGAWDGKIRLFNISTKQIYFGLFQEIINFAKEKKYTIEVPTEFNTDEFSVQEAKEFISKLKLPEKIKEKEYQLQTFISSVRNKRNLFLSPTGSGKSFMIYLFCKYFSKKQILIIVPTINLVNQMKSDFIEYDLSGEIEKEIQIIKGGETKEKSKRIIISTWQSVYDQKKPWFTGIEAVIGDEAHLCPGKSLTNLFCKLETCLYKIGFTGTLNGENAHKLIVTGLFGPVIQVKTIQELIESKDLAELKIKSIVLNYDKNITKQVIRCNYHDELEFLFNNKKRNKFIENLALSLKGNTLVIFSRIEHGKLLKENISKRTEYPTYLVYGDIKGDERETIRKTINTHENSITIASTKTFSTGINIPNLNNIIFAFPTKSRISIFQSIGRGLRITDTKKSCTIFDIADNLSSGKWKNTTYKHYLERLTMYVSEKLKFKEYKVEIK